jgi:outer membrane protein assembly factor BamE (lipoprotein component of BamABCDE complex)
MRSGGAARPVGKTGVGYHTEFRRSAPIGFSFSMIARSYVSLVVALFAAITLSGCGWVYKMEINQGNFITQDMVDKLREGQTRQQVRFALGTPVTESVFHPDRWDYNFSLERRGKQVTKHRLTVVFDGDKLKSWSVADLPKSPMVDRDPAYAVVDPMSAKSSDDRGFWSRLTDWWRK